MIKNLAFIFVVLSIQVSFAQTNVGIGTTTPNPNAILDLNSSSQGLLLPRLTSADTTSLDNPINEGMLFYNTTDNNFYSYDGTNWRPFTTGTNSWGINANDIYKLNSGNVGIGTSTPRALLEVYAITNSPSLVSIDNSVASLGGQRLRFSSGDVLDIGFQQTPVYAAWFQAGFSGISEAMLLNPLGGNIGIGTNNPLAHLDIRGNGNFSNPQLIVYNTNGGDFSRLRVASSGAATSHWDIAGYLTGTPSTERLNFWNQGASLDVMTLTGNGNVGIGTTNPSTKLDVVGGDIRTNGGLIINSFDPTLRFQDIDNRSGFIHMNSDLMYFLSSSSINATTWTINGSYWPLTINMTSDASTFGGPAYFMEGNVGIGTTSANAPLQFANTIANRKIVLWESANNDHQYYGLGINGATLRYQVDATGANHIFYAGTSSTTSNELMRIQGNGNVGIGMGAPAYRLVVESGSSLGASNSLFSSTDTWGTAINLSAGGGGSAYQLVAAGSAHPTLSAGSFAISNLLTGNVFTIDGSTGDVSIGALTALTTNKIGLGATPIGSSKVYISNTDNAFSDGLWVNNAKTSGTTWGIYLTASNSGSATVYGIRGSASASGGTHYGVYGTAGGTGTNYGVYCAGNGAYTGSWSFVSDENLKTNVRNYNGALQNVMKLEPKQYEYKTAELPYMNLIEGDQIGLIAQDVQKIFPHLVTQNVHPGPTDEKGRDLGQEKQYLGIDYIQLVPILTQAIKEQQSEIDNLKKEIELLKEK